MDSETIDKVATTVVIAGAAFVASKLFEIGWKAATKRPVPAEDADDVTMASLVVFAATHTGQSPSHEGQVGRQVGPLPRRRDARGGHGLLPGEQSRRQ